MPHLFADADPPWFRPPEWVAYVAATLIVGAFVWDRFGGSLKAWRASRAEAKVVEAKADSDAAEAELKPVGAYARIVARLDKRLAADAAKFDAQEEKIDRLERQHEDCERRFKDLTGTWSYTSTEFGVVGDPDGVPAASVTDATLVNHSEVPVPVPELQVALLFTDPPELLLLFSRSTTASDATGLTLADDNAPSYALAYARNDGSGPIFTVTGVTGGTAVNPRLSYAGGGTLVGVEGGVVAAFTDQAVSLA